MRKFKGKISINARVTPCYFEFEVDDDATEEEIEDAANDEAQELLSNYVIVQYEEVNPIK